MAIDYQTMNAAALFLYGQNRNYTDQDRAGGALRMTQLISEAARFRAIRDEIAVNIGPETGTLTMPGQFVEMENNWSTLSGRFNSLLRHDQNYQDPNPLTAYRRDAFGRRATIILTTAILYAQYILGTSNGR